MKLYITHEQWNEISEEKQHALRKLFAPTDFVKDNICRPAMDIGQMIEFMGDKYWSHVTIVPANSAFISGLPAEEVCDSLWDAVKEKLCQDLLNENKLTAK